MSDSAHVFTLGIEEEFQIIDPETRELRSHIQQILDDGKITLKEHVKPDLRSNAGDPDELCHPFALDRHVENNPAPEAGPTSFRRKKPNSESGSMNF